MARPRRRDLQPSDIEGLEYFDMLAPLLGDSGTSARARPQGQSPSCSTTSTSASCCSTSSVLRSPACAPCNRLPPLRPSPDVTGIRATALGSGSAEPARLFDAQALHQILRELAGKAAPIIDGPDARQLLHLTAVDGSIFRAFPRMAWALWKDAEHRGIKLHLHFDVFCSVPVDAAITVASGSETDRLRAMLQRGRLYVIDRGYLDHELYREILEAGSSFIGRIKDNGAYRWVGVSPGRGWPGGRIVRDSD